MRTYEIANKRLPSVTTILSILRSPSLERWRGDVGNLVADSRMTDGASRGTNVHTLCEYLCKHGTAPPSIPTHLRTRYTAFAAFYDTHVARVLDCESVVSYQPDPITPSTAPKLGYAGRCDLIAVLQSGLVAAIDIKTSKVITEKMGMQLAAYSRAYTHTQTNQHLQTNQIQPIQLAIDPRPTPVIQTRIVVQLHADDHHYPATFPIDYAAHTPTQEGYDLYEFLDYDLDLYGFDSAAGLFMWASRSGLIEREFARPTNQ